MLNAMLTLMLACIAGGGLCGTTPFQDSINHQHDLSRTSSIFCSAAEIRQYCASSESRQTTKLVLIGCEDFRDGIFRGCDLPELTEIQMTGNHHMPQPDESKVPRRPPRAELCSAAKCQSSAKLLGNYTFLGLNAPKLGKVQMNKHCLSSLEGGALAGLPSSLYWLDLSDNCLTYVEPGVLSNLTSLVALDLDNNFLTEILPKTFTYTFRLMAHLTLANNEIARVHPKALYGLSAKRLDLSSNALGNFSQPDAFTHLQVDDLYLRFNYIHNLTDVLQSFQASPDALGIGLATSVDALYLSNNNIRSVSGSLLEQLFSDGLDQLSLANNPISFISPWTLVYSLYQCYTIDLTGTEITDPSLLSRDGCVLYALPSGDLRCVVEKTVSDEKATLAVRTKCECSVNFALRGGKCVDQTPLYVVGGSLGSAVVASLVTVLVFFALRRYRRKLVRLESDLGEREALLSRKDKYIKVLRSAWVIPADEVDLTQMIDSGSFGEVWRAKWGTLTVAVKVLKQTMAVMGTPAFEEFGKEVEFLIGCRHRNIVRFFGAGQRQGMPFIVMEYLSRGSLRNLLQKSNVDYSTSLLLSWEQKISFALDIAEGMAYIHSQGHMHRDLKTDNVLLDNNLRCKLTDFGTVRQIVFGDAATGPARFTAVDELSRVQRRVSRQSTSSNMAPEQELNDGAAVRNAARAAVSLERSATSSGSDYDHDATSRLQSGRSGYEADSDDSPSSSSTSNQALRQQYNPAVTHSGLHHRAEGAVTGPADEMFETRTMSGGHGTPLYMAPEALSGRRYTFSADVFSFAVVMWEIAARKVPDLLGSCPSGSYLVQLRDALKSGRRLPLAADWPTPYSALIASCWQTRQRDRPTMSSVVAQLKQLKSHVTANMFDKDGGLVVQSGDGDGL